MIYDVGVPPRCESLEIIENGEFDTANDVDCFEAGYRQCLFVLAQRYKEGASAISLIHSVMHYIEDHFPDAGKMVSDQRTEGG